MACLRRCQESWQQRCELRSRDTKSIHSRHGIVSLGRFLILAWLIAWISTVPLFHIHLPDTTDRWSILQSGGAHTVLTPDLPGEYASPPHDNHREPSAHLATRGVNSPELGLVLFGEKAKRLKGLAAVGSLSRFRAPPLIHPFSNAFAASRAPPRSTCV